MDQTNCLCNEPSISLPVTGVELKFAKSAFENAAAGGIDYSLDEQWTGRRWIDGNKIYQKTIECGTFTAVGQKDILHGIENLSQVIKLNGSYQNSRNLVWGPIPFVTEQSQPNATIRLSCTSMAVSLTIWHPDHPKELRHVYVTILYTCSDR